MKKLVLAGLCCAGVLALLPQTGYAHGGQYRGPGDVVPPSPGGGRGANPGGPATPGPGGPATPGPAGPAAPGPAGPATGGPAGPAGGRGPTTGGRGIQLEADLNTWDYWWEFNKDPFIRLRDAIHSNTAVSGSDEFYLGATRKVDAQDTMSPNEEDRLNDILPALKKAIDSTEDRDITSSCMVAMAKVGRNHSEFKLRDVFVTRLTRGDQEINETAALSLGIAALPEMESLDVLVGLALDNESGRKSTGRGNVNERTRAFACYGLGLLAHANSDVALKRKAFDALRQLVEDDSKSSRDTKVAALNAIGILNTSSAGQSGPTTGAEGSAGKGGEDAKTLLDDAVKCLEAYYMRDLGSGNELLQSHAPTAIAKLLGRNSPDAKLVEKYKKLFADDLAEKGKVKRSSNDIPRSCVLALGQLCQPIEDEKSADIEIGKQLLETWKSHKDLQTKYFSILALGQIGGNWCRQQLLKEFDKAGKSIERPWVALAMGVYSFQKYEAQQAAGQTINLEVDFGKKIQDGLKEGGKDPIAQSGLAVALGLCRFEEAADDLRDLLSKSRSKDDLAGYLCIALSLMGDKRSMTEIRDIASKAVRRPELLQQAAIALGKLGDKTVADELQKLLGDGDTNLAKMSAVASALGFIGDRRTIQPLKKMMQDESLTPLSRAFAAVALGGVGDKEKLPWNSKIGQNINYRAAVSTLTDKQAGILDIL